MTRIEQPHHSIRWRRGEPSIEWGHAQVLARAPARAQRGCVPEAAVSVLYCVTRHTPGTPSTLYTTTLGQPSQQQARGFRPRAHLPYATCDDRGYENEYEPDPERRKRRAPPPDADARPVFVRSVTRCTVSVWPRPSVPRGCAGVPGSGVPESVAGPAGPRSVSEPSRPRLVRLAAVLYVKTYITSREDWEVVGLVIWRYRISHVTTSRAAARARTAQTRRTGPGGSRPDLTSHALRRGSEWRASGRPRTNRIWAGGGWVKGGRGALGPTCGRACRTGPKPDRAGRS